MACPHPDARRPAPGRRGAKLGGNWPTSVASSGVLCRPKGRVVGALTNATADNPNGSCKNAIRDPVKVYLALSFLTGAQPSLRPLRAAAFELGRARPSQGRPDPAGGAGGPPQLSEFERAACGSKQR